MSGRVVHFEVPFDDGERARAFYDDVLQLPGGPVALLVGAEYRDERGRNTYGQVAQAGQTFNQGTRVNFAGGYDVKDVFGEVRVPLINTDPTEPYEVHRGDRIAQLVVQRVEEVRWIVADSLDGFDRGGGFGHSGR